jgi:ribosomal-protein-alanine N-acetyltransferase
VIRAATSEDVEAVLALEEELFGADAWSRGSVAEELTGPRRRSVVAEDDSGVVGYAVAVRAGDQLDLHRIAVAATHRRRGLARRLLAAVAEPGMLLEVSADNGGARAFYAAEGFVEVGRRRRYYRDGSDALVLRLGGSAP